ncbi:MAG: hypothetical protein HFP81_03235 [Methylococcales symbiont of Hymedesmia sp. n. MRB-2018]|nr:MAG: hypothetical protein HFP78_06995 [Methylococcales symbiont of Hymedesmia sp. n. MRB-2018]KAF3984212.1 MAG: hypothetical protein HFP81_03235 [Methylococcales symbiont of Hymedesmia sp. n. MRB-2018]
MKKHWFQLEEYGVVWGMKILLKLYLLLGRQVLQIVLYPIVSYYWLINKNGRTASLQYLQRISPLISNGKVKSTLLTSYFHFINFANSLIDKLAAWSGSISLDEVVYHNRESIINHIEKGQGLFVFGSHLGNLEVCQVISSLRQNIKVNVLLHTKHAEKFNSLLQSYSNLDNINLIQVTDMNAATAMMLQDKIEVGELIVVAVDRTPVAKKGRTVAVAFLDAPAQFPKGPFILASLLKCPVYTLFCLREGNKLAIYFDHFSDGLNFPRKKREQMLQQCVQNYANILQRYCLQAPLQWFNFYNFWQDLDE